MTFSRLPLRLLRLLPQASPRFGSVASAVRLPAATRSIALSSARRDVATVDQSTTPSSRAIQALTLPVALTGQDILAQAKTGTGKTAAFLIPTLNAIHKSPPHLHGHVSCLIVSLTRELASQIAAEARTLAPAGTSINAVFGATRVNRGVAALKSGCDILVGTPGRLNDLIANYGLGDPLRGIKQLILDERDRLLDAGIKPDSMKICKALPDRTLHPRQTLLFSATVPSRLTSVVSLALLPGYAYLSSIPPEEDNMHRHVAQQAAVVGWPDIYGASLAVIAEEMQRDPESYKVIVFCPTARGAAVFYAAFTAGFDVIPVFQIHSRMNQPAREKASAEFKKCQKGILFSSDVTARGMDYPFISLVLQVGVPADPEQYIHRLGRTARAGKDGRGALILTPDERLFLGRKELRNFRSRTRALRPI